MPTDQVNKENPIMQYFAYAHLPAPLKNVSMVLAHTAKLLNEQLPDGPEKSTALRKMLEAKDCFVRSAIGAPNIVNPSQLTDGYHTFQELYVHRMELFKVICHQNKSHAWKSKLHDDGTMYPNYFIVGINTPEGSFTYHYKMEFWDSFNVAELERAPEWDGHTSADITRLHSLPALPFFGIDWASSSDHQVDATQYVPQVMDEATFKAQYLCEPKRDSGDESKFIGRRAAESVAKNSAKLEVDQYTPLQSRSTGDKE